LLFNDISDPQFDWPIDYRTLISFIDEKYKDNANVGQSGTNWAQSHTHAYYKVETRTTLSTNTVVKNKFEVDSNTYNTIATTNKDVVLKDGNTIRIQISKETQSYYDYEMELNESKRKIKLLKPELVNSVEEEFRRVIGQ
jgi:hypothetical protein